jgi:hypothetical protein
MGRLLPHHLNDEPLRPLAVKLAVEDRLPRAEVEFAVGDRHDHLVMDEQVLQVSVAVVLAAPVVAVVARVRQQRSRDLTVRLPPAWRRELVEPLERVRLDPRLVIVDPHAGGDVHRRDEDHALADPCVPHRLCDVLRDPHELPTFLSAEGAVNGVGFQTGEPGFEPGLTVLETARIAIISLPFGRNSVQLGTLDGSRTRRGLPSRSCANICSSVSHDAATYRAVIALVADCKLSDYEVARLTSVPRPTVQRWRRRAGLKQAPPPQAVARKERLESWKVHDAAAYCYLLGAYLGDGTVCVARGAWLQIVNDRRYPGVSEEILAAMRATFPDARPRTHGSHMGESDVHCVSHPAVVRAFPQHGAGRKHLRPIVLERWQLELTRAHPAALVRGLIHSDGCRTQNRFTTTLPSGRVAEYSYTRYFFSNLSADIRQIFIDHCELLGIRVTQSNHRNLSISHRDSVVILERIVGPKR